MDIAIMVAGLVILIVIFKIAKGILKLLLLITVVLLMAGGLNYMHRNNTISTETVTD